MKVLFDKTGQGTSYEAADLSIDENNTMYLTVKSSKTGKAIKQYVFTNVVPTIVGDINYNDVITNVSFNFCYTN